MSKEVRVQSWSWLLEVTTISLHSVAAPLALRMYSNESQLVDHYPSALHLRSGSICHLVPHHVPLFTSSFSPVHKQDSCMCTSIVLPAFTMSGKQISATVRGQIIEAAAWQSLRTVALRFQCSHCTVSCLVCLKEAGHAEPPPKHAGGRPKNISERAKAHIRRITPNPLIMYE